MDWARRAPGLAEAVASTDPGAWARIARLHKERARTWEELEEQLEPFFREEPTFDPKAETKHLGKPTARPLLLAAAEALESVENFSDPETLEQRLRTVAEEKGVKFGLLVHPWRVALTGRDKGAGLTEIMAALGRERTLGRLRAGAARCLALSESTP